MKVNIGGVEHEIETMHYPKQPPQYHDAVKERDWNKAMLWKLPDIPVNPATIQAKIASLQLKADYEANIERINNMSEDMLRIEMKLEHGVKFDKDESPKSFWDYLFCRNK